MSIEQAIQENTAAMAKLTDMIRVMFPGTTVGFVLPPGPEMTATEVMARKESAAPKKAAGDKPKPSSGIASVSPASSAPKDSGVDITSPMAYEQLQAPGIALYKANRESLVELLKYYGVAKMDMIPQEKWPEALGKVNAALANFGETSA